MKLKYMPLLLLISTTVFAADITDSDKPIMVTKNNIVTLRIESNPTTGYSWYLKTYDPTLIKPMSENYQAPKKLIPGRGGVDVWKFRLLPNAMNVPHIMEVTLEYRRPWEMDSGLTRTFQIVTR